MIYIYISINYKNTDCYNKFSLKNNNLPISKDTKHPSGFKFLLSSSPICRTISPLAGDGIDVHCGHALRASVIALLAS